MLVNLYRESGLFRRSDAPTSTRAAAQREGQHHVGPERDHLAVADHARSLAVLSPIGGMRFGSEAESHAGEVSPGVSASCGSVNHGHFSRGMPLGCSGDGVTHLSGSLPGPVAGACDENPHAQHSTAWEVACV
jgi:hypothetical protein